MVQWLRIHLQMQVDSGRFYILQGNQVHLLQLMTPHALKPMFCNYRSHCNEKPGHLNQRVAPTRHNYKKPACRNKDPAQEKKKKTKTKNNNPAWNRELKISLRWQTRQNLEQFWLRTPLRWLLRLDDSTFSIKVHACSATQLCPTLCSPMDCIKEGIPKLQVVEKRQKLCFPRSKGGAETIPMHKNSI